MIEVRWIVPKPSDLDEALGRTPEKVLQWRKFQLFTDAAGALTPIGGAWDSWQDVPTVSDSVWTGLGDK